MAIHLEAIDAVMENKRAAAIGQFDLFGEAPLPSPVLDHLGSVGTVAEWEKGLLLAYEREMLGLYVSDHPLLGIEHVLATLVDRTISAIASDDLQQDQIITIGGLVTSIQRKMSRQGAPWAIVTIEDLEGAVDVMFYSQTYATVATQLTEDVVVIVRGRVDKREEVARVVALDMTIPDVASAPRGPLVISMPVSRCTPPTVERLKDVLRSYPGTTEVHLSLDSPNKKTVMRLEDSLRVALTPALSADLKALLGAGCLS
jgi:DNA polymerase-3 subunit alpha